MLQQPEQQQLNIDLPPVPQSPTPPSLNDVQLQRLEYARRIQAMQQNAMPDLELYFDTRSKKTSLFDDPIAVGLCGAGVLMLGLLGMFTIVANSLPNPQAQQTTREWASVAREIAKSKDRPNVVCISWDCGQLAQQSAKSATNDRDWVGYWQQELPKMNTKEVQQVYRVCQASTGASCEAFQQVVYHHSGVQ